MDQTRVIRLMLVGCEGAFDSALLRALQESDPDALEVVGRAASLTEACQHAARMRPDVILLDLDTLGLEAVSQLAAQGGARVLALATQGEVASRARAVRAGARGVLAKGVAPATLRKAVRKVRDGELWLDRITTGRMLEDLIAASAGAEPLDAAERIAGLTAREREIVQALLRHEGASGRALAERLKMSEQTLRNHFSAIYRKLGIPNRVGLAAYAARLNLDRARSR